MKMKLIVSLVLALSAPLTLGATLVPVQSLNPAGSTTGQAVVSTGPSTPPGWASISAGSLAPIAANRVLGNFTASSAAPTAFTVPSCSAANSALQYTNGTGLSCGATFALTSGTLAQFAPTTSAQFASVISDETGTGLVVLATSPSITTPTLTTPTITGVTNGSSAAAGNVGEYLSAGTNGTSLTSTVAANAASQALTAGDYDAQCIARFNPAGTTTWAYALVSVNTTSATVPGFTQYYQIVAALTTGQQQVINSPTVRISSAGATTAYCVVTAQFGVSTMTVDGSLRIRRIR